MASPTTTTTAKDTEQILLVLTGPTGAGKTTVMQALFEKYPEKFFHIKTTVSRPMREGESEGNPYYFVSEQTAEELVAQDAYEEWMRFRGFIYGTRKKTFYEGVESGKDLMWVIDLQGVKNVKDKMKQNFTKSIFIYLYSDKEVLYQRVVSAEGEEKAKLRWHEDIVERELAEAAVCDTIVYNQQGKLSETIEQIETLMRDVREKQ